MPSGSTNLPANANLTTLRANLAAYRQSAPRVRGGSSFINFSKGEWTYGQRRTPLDLDCAWMVAPTSLEHGYICWRNSQIFHEVLLPIGQVLPAEISLPEPPAPGKDESEGYQYQIGFTCVCVDGSLEGEQSTFKSSSVGGTGAIQKLLDDLDARLEECEATGNPRAYPVIQFGADSYQHKTRGKIWVPTISVVGFSANIPGEPIEWLDEPDGDGGWGATDTPPPPPPPAPTRLRRVAK